MKTAVTRSSLRSYDLLKASGFCGQHAAIVSHMQKGQLYSRRQIAKLTGLETSSVAGRIFELVEQGQVVVCGTLVCPLSKRHVEAVKLADEQMELLG